MHLGVILSVRFSLLTVHILIYLQYFC
uniref:Uncharacterized protein n=1 Tax=Lepeophtheirus salmonis TaxID=72036 RepID=A0A0K2T3P0_LEPSM